MTVMCRGGQSHQFSNWRSISDHEAESYAEGRQWAKTLLGGNPNPFSSATISNSSIYKSFRAYISVRLHNCKRKYISKNMISFNAEYVWGRRKCSTMAVKEDSNHHWPSSSHLHWRKTLPWKLLLYKWMTSISILMPSAAPLMTGNLPLGSARARDDGNKQAGRSVTRSLSAL